MDINSISGVIAQLGFPIAACIALFWYCNKERENHKEEIDALKTCINENNIILASLKTLLESIERRLNNDN